MNIKDQNSTWQTWTSIPCADRCLLPTDSSCQTLHAV